MTDLSTGKSVVVCAVVLGCFAVLWPKIFYPMFYGSTSYEPPVVDRFPRPDRPIHMSPDMVPPSMRDGSPMRGGVPTDEIRRTIDKDLRPGPVPGMRPTMGGPGIQPQMQRQGQGAMGILMPLYTVGIVIFFVYTIMKLIFKTDEESHNKPYKKPSSSLHNELLKKAKVYPNAPDSPNSNYNLSPTHELKAKNYANEASYNLVSNEQILPQSKLDSVAPSNRASQENLNQLSSPEEKESTEDSEDSEPARKFQEEEEMQDTGSPEKKTKDLKEEVDHRDEEIAMLKARLAATESAMSKIISQMENLPKTLQNMSPLKKIIKNEEGINS